MTRRRPAPDRRRVADRSPPSREWVGGRLSPPFYIHDREEPYRPDLVIWLELPEGLIVGQSLVMPEDREGALARGLRSAVTQPAAGSPRQPDVIRVADAATAAEVRAEVGEGIPVRVAPTPELDALLAHLIATLPPDDDNEPSYFAWGRVSAAAVEKLFAAGRLLFAVRPWAVAADTQVLRMDIPALGVDGACLSVIGQLGESRGVLIFASLADFESFVAAAESGALEQGPLALGAGWLALTFAPATELPPSMRREAMEHGWPVERADAYPLVERRDPDGMPRPLVERDVEVAAACALSLGAFFAKHGAIFKSDTFAPVCESYFDDDDREVRFTVPYHALADFELSEAAAPGLDALAPAEAFRPRAGRNAPCPCGSGRKYKKCHLAADEAEHASLQATASTHAMDERLVRRLSEFALREYGETWEAFEDDFADPDEALPLALPWSVYCFRLEGKTIVDAYLEDRARRCSREERLWLEAQRAAWLSVWEVEAVDAGKTVTLHDLLSDERRTVYETRGSRTLVARDAVLARIVDHDGVSLLCGVHPRPLPPVDAAEVVRRARVRLRRKRSAPVDRLRDTAFGRNLIRYWEEAVEELDERRAIPPDLRNRDGDPLLLTVDHFEVAAGAMPAIEACVAELDGAHREPAGEDLSAYVFLRPDDPAEPDGEHTLVGRLRIGPEAVRIETNSEARADALRARVERACGSRLRHRAREHMDPRALARQPGPAPDSPPPPSPDEQRLVAEFKKRHYADWLDQPLPALDRKTPRESVRTAAGRAAVDLLLKDMEHMEHMEQRAPGAPFDFTAIRRELGIAPP